MIPNTLTLLFIFSLTAKLLLPCNTHHVNFNTWCKIYSNNGSATTTAEITDEECSSMRLVARSLSGTATITNATSSTTICSLDGKNCTKTSSTNDTRNTTVTSSSSGSGTSPPAFSPSPSISISPTILLSPSLPPAPVSGHSRFPIIKFVIGVAAVMGGLMICIISYCLIKNRSTTKSNQDIEAFLKANEAVAQKRYKFSQVKKMTNSFKVKLGQGGFGAVYKGQLPNGCHVAVKLLNASKGNGKDFINEVGSISRTSHVNIVTLLGFCLEGSKKALIYEFMANGSLDKFIYKKGPEKTIASLSWENLYQISIGIARGLEYLHRGCNTRILHFDIKPHNILLDENFCPKISDFGLAKLCPRNESTISISDTRGTTGYKAPEVWNKHLAGVSHKSDVYSYGMMLLEMVGGRKNLNVEASHLSELYFPHVAYKRLELENDVIPNEVMSIEENEIAKRMTIVGLWCIQSLPNDRPTMSRVVDMLEGNMNSLEMPPKPMLSSSTISAT